MIMQNLPLFHSSKKICNTRTSKAYRTIVENELNMSIKMLHTENGREFMSSKFKEYLQENCIIHQHMVAYNPQQNAKAERKNLTLIGGARSMLKGANLPHKFYIRKSYTCNKPTCKSSKNIWKRIICLYPERQTKENR